MSVDEQSKELTELMRQAQEGDSVAYQSLLTQISRILKDYLGRRLSKQEAVEELVQEILLSIHTARHTFDAKKPFRPWMFAIARHKLIDYFRRCERTVAKELHDDFVLSNLSAPPGEEYGHDQLSESLQEALAGLSQKQRLAVELLKLKGMSIKEAATQLEMSESAVKVTAHRAYKALRKKLGENAPAES